MEQYSNGRRIPRNSTVQEVLQEHQHRVVWGRRNKWFMREQWDCQSAGNQVSSVLSLFIYDISEVMCAHAQACRFFSLKIGILVISEVHVNAYCDICRRFPK